MAKKTKTKTRRKRSLSSGGTVRRRKSVRRSKGILSEFMNPTVMANSAKTTLSAMTGGGAAVVMHKMIPASWGKLGRLGLAFALGFGAAAFGMPNVGSGLTGGLTALSFPNGFLNEDSNYANNDVLSDMPLFLDEDGQPMVLEEGEDGQAGYRYLSESEIETLQEQGAFDNYQEV